MTYAQQVTRKEYNDAAWRAHAVEDEYEKAERLFRAAIDAAESAGLKDEIYVKSLDGLATVLRKQAKYAAAEAVLKQAIAVIEQLRGPESVDVVIALGQLTNNHLEQCNFAQAVPSVKKALSISQKLDVSNSGGFAESTIPSAIGSKEEYVASSLGRLASLYSAQGNYAEAEALYERAIRLLENSQHDLAFWMDRHMAGVLSAQGANYIAQAATCYRMAANEYSIGLGPDHISVAEAQENYGATLRKIGRAAEAEFWERRATEIRHGIVEKK